MNATDFYNHVLNKGICSSLIDTGTMDEEWELIYCELLEREKKKYREQFTWPIEVFRGIHFASLYLPLRYMVWRTNHSANLVTEQCLQRIKIVSELFLWNCLLDDGKWSDSRRTDAEASLVRLCFGSGFTELNSKEVSARQRWREEYESLLRTLSCDYLSNDEWPQIVCMAIRYASWIIDLFQFRIIESRADYTDDKDLLAHASAVVDGLRKYVPSDDALSMIRVWIQALKNPIDHSGAPIVGKSSELGADRICVRKLSEIFIQRGSII